MRLFLLHIFTFVALASFAQVSKTDSLLTLLKSTKQDTVKTDLLNLISFECRITGNYKDGLTYANEALKLATKSGKQSRIAKALTNIGVIHYYLGNYPEALKNYFNALKIREAIGDKKGISISYNNIGITYDEQGNYAESMKYYFICAKIREELNDKLGLAEAYNNIGVSNMNLAGILLTSGANYDSVLNKLNAALKIYLVSLKLKEETGNRYGISSSYNNIGLIYTQEAEVFRLQKKNQDTIKVALQTALKNYGVALKIREETGDKEGLATTFVNIGEVYAQLKQMSKAQLYLNKALALSKLIGSKDDQKVAYLVMVFVDSAQGNFKAALEHRKLFILYRDSLDNEESRKKIIQSSMSYAYEKKEIIAIAEQEKQNAIHAEEKTKQRILMFSVAGVLLLVIIFSLFVYNRFRIAKSQKQIIELQKKQVDEAYDILHEKNKEVLDSIHYARRIQRSLLTSEKYIAKQLSRLIAIPVICSIAFAQQTLTDSLTLALSTSNEDSNRVKIYRELVVQYEYANDKKAFEYATKELSLSKKLGYKKGIGSAYMQLGFLADDKGDYALAIKNHLASLQVRTEDGDKKRMADSYTCLGVVYDQQGNFPEALRMYYIALRLYELVGDKIDIASVYNNIGIIYDEQGNYEEALKNHFTSLKYEEINANKEGIASSYINIGIGNERLAKYPEALKYYLKALELLKGSGNKLDLAHCYNNIGVVYHDIKNYSEALKAHFLSLKLREEIGSKIGMASSYCNIGYAYSALKDFAKANEFLIKARDLSKEIGSKDNLKFAYRYLSELNEKTGDFKAAFENHKLFILTKDSLYNEETQKKTLQNALGYQFEKKELAAKAQQDKLNAISTEEKEKQRIIIYLVFATLLIVAGFSLFLVKRFRVTQKQKGIIEKQKILVDTAYSSLHERNKEIMDSIFYARRIQRALITSEKYIERILKRDLS